MSFGYSIGDGIRIYELLNKHYHQFKNARRAFQTQREEQVHGKIAPSGYETNLYQSQG